MIIRAYQTLREYNQTDLAGLFTYPASVVPIFIPLVLFAVFVVTLLSTFFSEKRLRGQGDFFSSFAVAGYFTAVIAFAMSMTEGLIDITTIVITVVVAIIGTILLFATRGD